jgi:hypothetical protein
MLTLIVSTHFMSPGLLVSMPTKASALNIKMLTMNVSTCSDRSVGMPTHLEIPVITSEAKQSQIPHRHCERSEAISKILST